MFSYRSFISYFRFSFFCQYNTAFSEDTQRGTDRLIRAILQDLTELDRETQVKPGKERAVTKVLKNIYIAKTFVHDFMNVYSIFHIMPKFDHFYLTSQPRIQIKTIQKRLAATADALNDLSAFAKK